ncbi:hypothetical protein [Nocardia sp. alder85J]|uniref:hypothetical protein n=1 Tax=Nocardia sp. alder85J TaxID=2862949 RepID=UPI001CD5F187|nr:hypothetical protein [Nocardia sp. alder85J]MCX4098421.1 hypothetical protein [Nocardia sp. alder85J]
MPDNDFPAPPPDPLVALGDQLDRYRRLAGPDRLLGDRLGDRDAHRLERGAFLRVMAGHHPPPAAPSPEILPDAPVPPGVADTVEPYTEAGHELD